MATRTAYGELTADQERHSLDHGYVVIEQAVVRDLAGQWRDLAYRRLGYDAHDPATWLEPKVHLPVMNRRKVAEVAPRAWDAICDLLGGEERIRNGADYSFGDSFIINFHHGADQPWQPPSPRVTGWHKDGDFFRYFQARMLAREKQRLGQCISLLFGELAERGGTMVQGKA